MRTAPKLAMLLVFALWPLSRGIAAEVNEAPVEIVVLGRQPGPPLWKVSSGDKVLWIFPYLNWVPQHMIWESERVARVIAESQEVLNLPERSWEASVLRRNPINIALNGRLMKRLIRNPDGGTLEENLPPELYMRFAALQARYFPNNDGIVELRPLDAGRNMMRIIRQREGLVPGDDILKTIQRLVRRNRDIKRTEISVSLELGDDFDEYARRMEAVYASFPPELEQACLEQQVRHAEEDLDEMKSRANTWAQGYIDEFRYVPLWEFNESNACAGLFEGNSSPEQEILAGRITRMNQMWLDAAERALAANASTFAVLPINELVAEDGLLSRLKERGYAVREP